MRIKPYKGGTLAVLDGGELIDIIGRWVPGQRLLSATVDGRQRIVQVAPRRPRLGAADARRAATRCRCLPPHVAELSKHMIEKVAAGPVAAAARADAGAADAGSTSRSATRSSPASRSR